MGFQTQVCLNVCFSLLIIVRITFRILCSCTVGASRNKTTPWEVNIFQRNECSLEDSATLYIWSLWPFVCQPIRAPSQILYRFNTSPVWNFWDQNARRLGWGRGMREGCIRRIDWSKRAKTRGKKEYDVTRNVGVSFHTNLNTDFWPFPIHLFFWLIAPIYIHTELACKLNALQSH